MNKFNKRAIDILEIIPENFSLRDRARIYWKLMHDLVKNEALNKYIHDHPPRDDMTLKLLKDKQFIEEVIFPTIVKSTKTKVDFPADMVQKLEKYSTNPSVPVHSDKIFKGVDN